jgi:UDP-N-acetylglucosamine--N-acetylmuramyl-(pentapeptide) pyrophosphoryl-undecaprenol N-acetylglucosamine transferase
MKSTTLHRVLISGGGTGGHIFPALAIADEFKNRFANAEFLFIGAKDKMEMQKVPEAGYSIEGLWISGISRSNWKENLIFPFKLVSSLWNSYKLIKKFKPTIAIGTGGFASGPSLWMANFLNIPIFLQEQNSYPGITNKFLAKNAKKICVAYEGLEKYFPKEKIKITGNPIRESISKSTYITSEAKKILGLDENKLVVLSVGGSLGSRTLNLFWEGIVEHFPKDKMQLIWQTGKTDYKKYENQFKNLEFGILTEFLTDMSLAYAAADIIISRAGAIAISELCQVGKPTILIPFPYAAEDHQTKNAKYLVDKNAAILISDKQVSTELFPTIMKLLDDEVQRNELAGQIKNQAKPNATQVIVDEILNSI